MKHYFQVILFPFFHSFFYQFYIVSATLPFLMAAPVQECFSPLFDFIHRTLIQQLMSRHPEHHLCAQATLVRAEKEFAVVKNSVYCSFSSLCLTLV